MSRLARRAFVVVGGIANLLGIYAFGESHHWWPVAVSLSIEGQQASWMLAVGIGGPWAMILGTVVGAKLAEAVIHDKNAGISTIHAIVYVAFFAAAFHCAEMQFGITIFAQYLNPVGFAVIFASYLGAGLVIGSLMPLITHSVRSSARSQ